MSNKETNYGVPLAFITMLFFMWGFITCLNDILIPHFKEVFTLTYFQSMLIQFAFFGAYFVGSIIYFIISSAVGDPINKIGYKNGIILGLGISALGTFLFYPAAIMVSFGFFLTALFVLALGFTLLQIAANPYVTMLGKPETGSHRLSLAGAINSFGTTIAPILGGALILGTATESTGLDSVKTPYLFLTALFLILMLVFKFVHLPDFSNKEEIEKGTGALQYPQLVLGILAIFFYVGEEVTIGSFMSSYVQLPEIKGVTMSQSTLFVTLYWGSLMIGRFTGSLTVFNFKPIVKKVMTAVVPVLTFFFILMMIKVKSNGDNLFQINEMVIYIPFIIVSVIAFFIGNEKPARTLMLFSIICIALLILAVTTSGELALWSAISVGLYNSIMWPAIFSLAIAGLGKHTSQGSSLLIMAILGGALIPPLQGLLADAKGVQFSFIIPIFCFVYLAYYGWKVRGILQKQNIDLDAPVAMTH